MPVSPYRIYPRKILPLGAIYRFSRVLESRIRLAIPLPLVDIHVVSNLFVSVDLYNHPLPLGPRNFSSSQSRTTNNPNTTIPTKMIIKDNNTQSTTVSP